MAVEKQQDIQNFGVHDKLEVGSREFHIHTGTLVEQGKIISEVFEKGMFLISREFPIRLRNGALTVNYDFLSQVAQNFHYRVIEDLEMLYRIAEKIKRFRHARSHYHLGAIFLRLNLYQEAAEQFEAALALEKDDVLALTGLAISYLKQNRYQQAAEVFERAIVLRENFPDVINYYALTQLFLGHFNRAMTLFKRAIDLNPNYVEAQFNLGVALYKSALEGVKDPSAVAVPARVSIYLKQVRDLEKYRDPSWQREFTMLLELLKHNNHDIILPELEKFQLRLVSLGSEKDKIYEFYLRFLFGGKEIDQQTIEKYQPYFEELTDRFQQYPDYWNDLGTFNLIKSRTYFMQALSEFEKALELAPNYQEARTYLEKIKSSQRGFLILLRAILK